MTLSCADAAQAANSAAVVYVVTRLHAQFEALGKADPMRGFLSYGSLRVERSEPDLALLPHAPWAMVPAAQALERAVQDTNHPTPMILCFAHTRWRLLIACRTVQLPEFGDAASFGSITNAPHRALLARLHHHRAGTKAPDPTALRAWSGVVQDDAAMSVFISTALAQCLPVSASAPAPDLTHADDDDGERP